MRRLLPVLFLLLLVALPAQADDATQVALALRTGPVYQAKGLDLVDVAVLTGELGGRSPRVVLAVLPASAASSADQARSRAVDIGQALGDPDAVVLVITANKHLGVGAGHAAVARGVDAASALSAELAAFRGKDFSKDNLTVFVTSFAERVAGQAATVRTTATRSGSSHSGAWLLGGLALLGAGGAAAVVVSSRRRHNRLNDGLRAEVEQLYSRLASDVATLDPKQDEVAKQALADAAERFNACGASLAQADSPAEFAAARRTAVEGLTAARTARTALGLDPGPDLPVVPGSGPQLEANQNVPFAGQTYDGSPSYQPGQPHYFGGGTIRGQQVPGGWYSTPFWEPFLLGSILFGGFGGGLGGGFERGYEAGQQDAGDGGGGGGDWSGGSSGGGGDWGGGGGDGGGGGGDW